MLTAYIFYTAKIYLLPLRVTIDKHANKINIYDFGVPKKNVNLPFINGIPINIDIDQLQQITFVDGHLFANISSAKNNDQFNFSFILRNNTSISLQSGTFVYSAHRIACTQIADYLSIPFEDQIHELSVLANHGSINTTIKIKNILFKILFVLLFLLLLIIITLLVAINR